MAFDDSDEEKVFENSSLRGNRRRRKKISVYISLRFEVFFNDVSFELLLDMVVEFVYF